MVAQDLNLMGAIVSTILEKISKACEEDCSFEYTSTFTVMDREYTLSPHGAFVILETEVQGPDLSRGTDN
jgi:hypothetical protein